MKTRILSCLAALLLASSCAFAQTVAKADVNDDGIVDVADVVSVAAIMKAGAAIPITSIGLASVADAYTGLETQLTPSILPTYATDKSLTWSSSNTSVATVSQTGVVKGVAEGTTTITVTTSNGKKATCEVTVHQTVYYWYVGQTDPSTMTEISPIVDDNTSPGWRLIGTTLPTYNISNKLWDGTQISTGTTKQTNYVALPNNTLFMYDAAGNISSGSWLLVGETEIGGLTYYVYSSVANLKTFGFNIY